MVPAPLLLYGTERLSEVKIMENHASAKTSDEPASLPAARVLGRVTAYAEFAANSLRDAMADRPVLADNGWIREAIEHLNRIQSEYQAFMDQGHS
jgi:hypothetical protein